MNREPLTIQSLCLVIITAVLVIALIWGWNLTA
jgi:hypothetical protein